MTLRLLLASALLSTLTFQPLVAQEQVTDEGHPQLCGNITHDPVAYARAVEQTRLERPEVWQAMQTRRERKSPTLASVPGIDNFFVLNRASQTFDQVQAVLAYDGDLARIWVDVRDTARVKGTTIAALARGLDSATGSQSRKPELGIIANQIEVFGTPPASFEVEGKTDFLLTDIVDGMEGQGNAYVAGYFSPYDQSNDWGSNSRNLLYIDSNEGLRSGTTSLLNTIAHEFQHLLHYAGNPSSEVFFNEGCSEVAAILCGYRNRPNSSYLSNTNVSFLFWNYSDGTKLLADYQRAMTFAYYLEQQFGESFLSLLAKTRSSGMTRIDNALKTAGAQRRWQEIMVGFAAANYLLNTYEKDPFYRYEVRLSSSVAKVTATHDSLLPSSGSVSLQQYGTSYVTLTNPTATQVSFTGTRDFKVAALLYDADGPMDVVEVGSTTPLSLGTDGSIRKVVLAFVNLSGSTQQVRWTASEPVAGVERGSAATGGLRVGSVTPQPAVGRFMFELTSSSRTSAEIGLYDMTGRLVRTIESGIELEPGVRQMVVERGDLAAGPYLLRVTTADGTASRVVVLR